MNTNTQIDKIDKVLSKISGKEMKAFVWQYAALIAGYVMTITCREFKHDHLAYTPARYDVWAEENKVLKDIFVGEILFKDIKRLALLKEKPKEFNWLLGQIERVMRKSAAVDKIIKNGIKQLIADYPDKYYFKSYLGSIL